MSALTPHIKVLRAEADALTAEGQRALDAARVACDKGNAIYSTVESTAAAMLTRMSAAKLHAADLLEVEELAALEAMRS